MANQLTDQFAIAFRQFVKFGCKGMTEGMYSAMLHTCLTEQVDILENKENSSQCLDPRTTHSRPRPI